jgi:hypothetical protein
MGVDIATALIIAIVLVVLAELVWLLIVWIDGPIIRRRSIVSRRGPDRPASHNYEDIR